MKRAIWTDKNERVTRVHNNPSDVDTSGADVVETTGSPPSTQDWVNVTEYYNNTDGFYYQTSDPLSGLNLTDTEKQELYDAFQSNDIAAARQVVENALTK